MDTTTTPTPAWRQKIAAIRQRVDEADARKRQAELNEAAKMVNRQKQVDLLLLLKRLGIVFEGASVREVFEGESSSCLLDGVRFFLRYEESTLEQQHDVALTVTYQGNARQIWVSLGQVSDWILDQTNLISLDDLACKLDVALGAMGFEVMR